MGRIGAHKRVFFPYRPMRAPVVNGKGRIDPTLSATNTISLAVSGRIGACLAEFAKCGKCATIRPVWLSHLRNNGRIRPFSEGKPLMALH